MQEFPVLQLRIVLSTMWLVDGKFSPESKPEESAERHQALSSWVRYGHEPTAKMAQDRVSCLLTYLLVYVLSI